MKPRHRNRRVFTVLIYAIIALVGVVLLMKALGDNKQLFKNPSDIVRIDYVQGPNDLKVGGLVVEGSVEKPDALNTEFSIINFENADPNVPELRVHYRGVLPDLFRDGQGVVLTGKLGGDGVFAATNILAKHDENYMPKMPES